MARPSTHEGWLNQWRWRATNSSAEMVLIAIKPHLITKSDIVSNLLRGAYKPPLKIKRQGLRTRPVDHSSHMNTAQ
jgi:hypothetical protein